MKILVEDRVVETHNFPFVEALNFSILVWTVWGLAEAFFLEKVTPYFDPSAGPVDPLIYAASFLLHLAVAVLVAALAYVMVRVTMFSMGRSEPNLFRGATLAAILGAFFVVILGYHLPTTLAQSSLSAQAQYAMIAVSILLALAITYGLFRYASHLDFRIRRSGTTMLSVMVLSLVFSLVHFPLFSGTNTTTIPTISRSDSLKKALHKLTVFHYMNKLVSENNHSAFASSGEL
jgi:hypothetical protein